MSIEAVNQFLTKVVEDQELQGELEAVARGFCTPATPAVGGGLSATWAIGSALFNKFGKK